MDKNNENETPLRISRRKLSIMSYSSKDEEEKIIGEVTTTNYEKVIKILQSVKNYFDERCIEREMANDLTWVLNKIQSHTLYTYDVTETSSFSEKFSVENNEIKSFIEYLNDYSEVKEFQRRNRENKISKTQKININEKRQLMSRFSKRNKSVTNFDQEEYKKMKEESILKEIKFDEDEIDLKIISEKDFNIFKFESQVQTENLLPIIGKYSYTSTNVIDYLDSNKLDCFLETVRDSYLNVPYHNSSHGSDVCQTVLMILLHTGFIEALHLTPFDVISIITACLVHDLGHPALNNTFQINNNSDVAITYNDKSVLENFHVSECFRILRKENTNIFVRFDNSQYRNVRKRMIEMVLSTDMINHAKIVGLVKNRIISYNITEGKNLNKLINIDSGRTFDDQQEILNFIIHTCDLGHNAKSFDISLKWTYLLMNEFWNQGDFEREKSMPISFLCDRNTAEVPKSQVVFIKSIILPNYEVLVDMFSEMLYMKENIENNLNCWMKIYEENLKNQDN
jgi:hypothetical protein